MGDTPSIPTIAEAHAALTTAGSPFEMAEVDIDGVATRTWKHAPPSLAAVLQVSRTFGDAEFLAFDPPPGSESELDRLTFAEHFRAVATLAHRLIDVYGVTKGDRVAIVMRNYPEWSIAFWAASAAGAIVVPLNAWWTGPELEYGLADSCSSVVFCDAPRAAVIAERRAELPGLTHLIVAKPRQPMPVDTDSFATALGDWSTDVDLPPIEFAPEDEATIFYTSGTTGSPKGALGTQRNICGNLISLGFCNARSLMRSTPKPAPTSATATPQNVYLLSVPFFHATGCHSILVANVATGGKIVIMYKWDAGRALRLIEQERVTLFGGVPSMAWQVLEHPDFAATDISSVQSIAYGGAPAAPELVRRIETLFPGRIPSNGYGLTETSSVTTMNRGDDYLRHPDSVGAAVAVCDVQLVDADGHRLPPGSVGELWIKGPNVVRGYWHKPEATAAAFSDGWLHSGDIARIDDEGFIYIVDRAKDIVIRGGENVYCVEVEAALFEHPSVMDAAVIGIPDHVLGEEVGAAVHLTPGTSATEAELRHWCAERIAGFKVPVKIWFLDEPLPRNANGKITKRELKERLL
jgi:long-chain acyl-CoA synthetase